MTSTDTSSIPWYASYPEPRNKQPGAVTREQLLAMMTDGQSNAGKDYILVDVRRTDFLGGTIRGSINLPAQSLYPTIPTIYSLFKAAGVVKVIWYCCESL
jgi:arsenical-resistance protein 2